MQILKVGDCLFECGNDTEVWRAQGLLTKEAGTIAWLERTVRPDDVVYDIGANIGLYSVFAGRRLTAEAGALYGFEPHVGNARSLIRNLRINKLPHCRVLSVALHDAEGFQPFHYTSNEPGSSGSQVGEAITEFGHPFEAVSVEIKYVTTVDALLKAGVIRAATVIKIDVDGHEATILRGMAGLLQSPDLRSVQVEIHNATNTPILDLMAAGGFAVVERHHTAAGKNAIGTGADPMTVAHNAIFERPA